MKRKPILLNLVSVALLMFAGAPLRAQLTEPVLHWTLEEGAGTNTAEAVSGVTNVAHFVDGVAWTNGLAPGSSHAVNLQLSNSGYIDAGTLQTNGDYVAATDATDMFVLSNQWTITGWVELAQDSFLYNDQCILTSDTDAPDWWLFFIRTAGQLPNSLGFDFNSVRIDSGIDIPTGRPVFVCISGDQTALAFGPGIGHRFAVWDGAGWHYKEGVRYENIQLDGLEIGSFNNGTRQFEGTLDELRVYNTALSKAELAGLALNNAIGGDLGATVTAPAALTNATSLSFAVQFTEDVTGFDITDLDFSIGPSIFTGTPAITGSGSTYTVTLPVQGSGPVSLDLVPGSGVQTLGGDPLVNPIASSVVELDQTSPAATAITLIGANPTPALVVSFDVVFSEFVTGFNDSNDVLVAHSGTANTGVEIDGDGSNYVVTLTGVTGAGSFTVEVVPAGGTRDLAGNAVYSSVTSATVAHTIDTTPPQVVGVTPESTGPVTNGFANFTVAFSEPVIGFDPYVHMGYDSTNMMLIDPYEYHSLDESNYTVVVNCVVVDGAASGTFDARVLPSLDVTDLAGNPLLEAGPTSAVVTVSASPYQLWAIGKGLSSTNFNYALDPDGDGRNNAMEFLRDGNPLDANDPVKQRIHIAEVAGQQYGVLTIAAPDGFAYVPGEEPGTMESYFPDSYFFISDTILPTSDLFDWVAGLAPIVEDPSIATPPGMPALSPGWSYRHFRFADPVDVLPKAFMKGEAYVPEP